MKTVQLRRYEMVPELFDDFIPWWQSEVVRVREEAGFTIEFAYVNRAENEFIWAVSIPGDQAEFERVQQAYIESDARAKVFTEDLPSRVRRIHAEFVQSAL